MRTMRLRQLLVVFPHPEANNVIFRQSSIMSYIKPEHVIAKRIRRDDRQTGTLALACLFIRGDGKLLHYNGSTMSLFPSRTAPVSMLMRVLKFKIQISGNEPRASKLRERNLSRCVNGIHTILPTRDFVLNVASVMKSAKHPTWTWGSGKRKSALC